MHAGLSMSNSTLSLIWRVLFFTGCLWCTPLPAQNSVTKYLVVDSSSTVTIDGKSNVNKYQCAVKQYKGKDTLLLTAIKGKGAYFKKGWVKLNTSQFDCGLDLITNDFRKSIQSDKYPYIIIQLISFERFPINTASEDRFTGKIIVKLGNKAVPCQITCCIAKDDKNRIHLSGSHNFKFSDFNLEPPKRMMGMVKVDENITIDFHLVMTML